MSSKGFDLFAVAQSTGVDVDLSMGNAIGEGQLGTNRASGKVGIQLVLREEDCNLTVTNTNSKGELLQSERDGHLYYRAYRRMADGRFLTAFIHPSPGGMFGSLGYYPQSKEDTTPVELVAMLAIDSTGRVVAYPPQEEESAPF